MSRTLLTELHVRPMMGAGIGAGRKPPAPLHATTRAVGGVCLTLAALIVSGCGGGQGTVTDRVSGRDRATQLLGRMADALGQVPSYHMAGGWTDADGRTTVVADATAAGDLAFTVKQGSSSFAVRVVDGKVYGRGNPAFWTQAGANDAAPALADTWVTFSGKDGADIAAEMSGSAPRKLARCALTGNGTLRYLGRQRLAGKVVDVIADEGDKPGTSPGRLYIAADGPALPLRIVQTGPTRPGGSVPKDCGGGGPDTSTASDFRLSGFGEQVRIVAPPNARDLDAITSAS